MDFTGIEDVMQPLTYLTLVIAGHDVWWNVFQPHGENIFVEVFTSFTLCRAYQSEFFVELMLTEGFDLNLLFDRKLVNINKTFIKWTCNITKTCNTVNSAN